MGVFKRSYKTKDGTKKESKYYSYEFFIQGHRYQGTIDHSFALTETGKDLIPQKKSPETITKKEAERICDQLKDLREKQLFGEEKVAVLFDEIAASFYKNYLLKLEKRQKEAPHKSIRDYYNNIILLLQQHFGGIPARDIDKSHLATFRTKRRQQGVSDKTIRNDILALSSIFSHAEEEGILEDDEIPSFKSVTKKLVSSKQRKRYLSEKEYDQLINSFDKRAKDVAAKFITHGNYKVTEEPDNPYNVRTRKRMIMFDVETGLRRDEMLTLLKQDCDLEENNVTVRATKNGKDRTVPLSKLAKELLQEQLQETAELGIESIYLFCKRDGRRFTEFRKGLKNDCDRAGIKDLTTHDLRRTFGCWKLQGIRCPKMRIEEVSLLLGHSDISITQRAYAFLEMENIKLETTTTGTTTRPSGYKAKKEEEKC